MKVYSPNDVATILQIKTATLRKYSGMLEQQGYEIERNSQGHRYYQDKDIITLRKVIDRPHGGETLEETIQNVVKLELGSTMTNDINNGESPNSTEIGELKDMIHKQNELIQGLTERMDKQQEYISESIKERDKNLMNTMNEMLESKKQIAAADNKEERGFFKKLFGGK